MLSPCVFYNRNWKFNVYCMSSIHIPMSLGSVILLIGASSFLWLLRVLLLPFLVLFGLSSMVDTKAWLTFCKYRLLIYFVLNNDFSWCPFYIIPWSLYSLLLWNEKSSVCKELKGSLGKRFWPFVLQLRHVSWSPEGYLILSNPRLNQPLSLDEFKNIFCNSSTFVYDYLFS